MYTNKGLVKYAEKSYKSPNYYIYGTFGRVLTPQLIEQKIAQYPRFYSSKFRIDNARKAVGKLGFDCVGLIKGYYWDEGKKYNVPRGSDLGANAMFKRAGIKGKIDTLDKKQVGQIVYMPGHVGIHIGNGEVLESTIGWKSYKIIKTNLSQRKWTHWFECPFIKYEYDTPITKPNKTYKVKRGDYLIKIAKIFNVSWREIAKLNGITFPWTIYTGDTLYIPNGKEEVYIVKRGDTLSSIARRYNMYWKKIYTDNKKVIGRNPNIIKPGQRLIIRK